jgi:hypothetical protein
MPDHRHVKRSLLQGEKGKKKNEEEMGGGSYSRHEIVRDRHRRDLNGEKLLRRVITTKIMCCNISRGI